MEITVKINGRPYKINSTTIPVDTSLNTFIRSHAQLTGTKFMCLEGGCGVCIVTLKGIHPFTKEPRTWAVNSCLAPVFACHDLEVITIEGVGNRHSGYHPIQQKLYEHNGTQCGYCSPGMVMNMYSLMEQSGGKISSLDVENSFGGNMCRCTGYRPILDAFKSFATDTVQVKDCLDDIEDLGSLCKRTGQLCSGSCPKQSQPILLTFADDVQWYRLTTIQQIFDVLDKTGSKPYMLVAGNTAHGVYRRDPNLKVFIDVNYVEELRSHAISKDSVAIGANVNLSETMQILTNISTNPGFEYCAHLRKHIDLVANVPVRNAGTIAGNLSTKHAHREFPSDIFLILESVGAQLFVRKSDGNTEQMSIAEYLDTDMTKKVMVSIVLSSLDATVYRFRSFKIMPRAQNAHAYVNAGFLLGFKGDLVTSARVCFGGINPNFVHAVNAEQFLVGKNIYTTDVLQATLKVMADELRPDWELPDADPLYRKNLALSLFYKFIIGTCDVEKITPTVLSGGTINERTLSSGMQTFDTHKDKYPLTEPVKKLEGLIQCSGEALYSNDMPPMKDELWAAYVLTGRPHLKIGSIDASEALKIAGVHSFYSAKDIPGINNFAPQLLFFGDPEELFVGVDSKIKFFGQPAGMVLAETMLIANLAAKAVKITYVEDISNDGTMLSMARSVFSPFFGGNSAKQVIPTIRDAIALGATDRFQDAGKQLQAISYGVNTTKTIRGKFEVGSQYHYTMEAQTTVCIPAEDVLEVYSATQWPDFTHIAIAKCLGLPENKINLTMRRLGGGYGSKISRAAQIACACALGAYLTGRPVRFVLTIESNMTTVGKRYALASDYEVDIDDAGKIQRLHNNYAEDFGCSTNEPVPYFTTEAMENCYSDETWTINSQIALTDAPSHTFCRAPGTTEGIAMIENIMEHIAVATGRSPVDVRLVNIPSDNDMHKLLPQFLKDVEFTERQKEVDAFNNANRWKKRGIAFVPMRYPLNYFGSFSAFVAIYHADGTVAVGHSGTECGQGINTKVAQVVAYTLGIPLKDVTIKISDNLIAANAFVTGGSVASDMAAKTACEELLARIKPVRDAMPKGSTWAQITSTCNARSIDLTSKYLCTAADLQSYAIDGLSCAELEVDILTGSVLLRRVDILEDTGESMSPNVDVGQVEGSFVMGIGYWLSENLVYNRENGELLTNRTWTYKPPGAKDIPVDFRVRFMAKRPNPLGVLRSKATGEPAICMSVVVIFALRYALNSARKDAGLPKDEWYTLGSACTPDVIFSMTGNDPTKYTL